MFLEFFCEGLLMIEVKNCLEMYGCNEFEEGKKCSLIVKFFD